MDDMKRVVLDFDELLDFCMEDDCDQAGSLDLAYLC